MRFHRAPSRRPIAAVTPDFRLHFRVQAVCCRNVDAASAVSIRQLFCDRGLSGRRASENKGDLRLHGRQDPVGRFRIPFRAKQQETQPPKFAGHFVWRFGIAGRIVDSKSLVIVRSPRLKESAERPPWARSADALRVAQMLRQQARKIAFRRDSTFQPIVRMHKCLPFECDGIAGGACGKSKSIS